MAGLWAENRKIHNPVSPGSAIESATIITTESNSDLVSVHDRMPATMLSEDQIAQWLDPTLNNLNHLEQLLQQLRPSETGLLHLRRVSTRVNSPANDSPENIAAH